MKYQKIINLLDNTPDQPSKFETKNWLKEMMEHMVCTTLIVELDFKTSMLRSSLCDYSDT